MKTTLLIAIALCSMHINASHEQHILWKLQAKRSNSMATPLTQDLIATSSKPIIIKAFASWCPHCTKMKPIFEQLEKDLGTRYIFTEFDIDASPEFSKQFSIQSLPTFIFIKNHEEVAREVGSIPQENLKKLIVKYLG